MFIKKTHSKNKTYYSLAEGYREDGKVKHHILLQIGSVDSPKDRQKLETLALKLLKLAESEQLVVSPESIQETARQNWGASLVYGKLWETFGLDEILSQAWQERSFGFNALNAVFLMLLDRLILPSSKLRTYDTQDKYFGLPSLSLHHLYRSLDLLAESKEAIEAGVFAKNVSLFNMSVNVVFYDCTTFYFESKRADELKDFGFSKDNKINEVQVVLGLLVDEAGRPIGFDLYPGDKVEGKTLETALEKLKDRFKINKVILVADRGLCSDENIVVLKEKGYDFIVGMPLKRQGKTLQSQVLDLSDYQTLLQPTGESTLRYKVLEHRGNRIICTWSQKRAAKDKADRERLLEKARDLAQNPGKAGSKRGAKRYLKTTTQTHGLDEEKIKADEAWDGIYGILTSVKTLTPLEIHNAYHQLWRIEECFRVLKTNLETRPVYHWTPSRIKGHFVLCFLAFLLERTLEILLKEAQVHYSVRDIRDSLYALQLSVMNLGEEPYLLRAKPDELSKSIFKILEIKEPKDFEPFVV